MTIVCQIIRNSFEVLHSCLIFTNFFRSLVNKFPFNVYCSRFIKELIKINHKSKCSAKTLFFFYAAIPYAAEKQQLNVLLINA